MKRPTPAMHVATIIRRYKDKAYTTHLLRRSFRDGAHVRHETLANLSHLPPHLIDLLRRALQGETFVPASEALRTMGSLPHGHVQAVLGTLRKLQVPSLLASTPSRPRDLCLALIAERILFPASKLASLRHWQSTTLAEELHVRDATEKEVYRALDWLGARQKAIERKLAQRHLTEGCWSCMTCPAVSTTDGLAPWCATATIGMARKACPCSSTVCSPMPTAGPSPSRSIPAIPMTRPRSPARSTSCVGGFTCNAWYWSVTAVCSRIPRSTTSASIRVCAGSPPCGVKRSVP